METLTINEVGKWLLFFLHWKPLKLAIFQNLSFDYNQNDKRRQKPKVKLALCEKPVSRP